NNKRILAGTEQDIRDEITKSGSGFATESQVQALTFARNRTLIQRNSKLADLIQSQQDAINADTTMLQFEKSLASDQFNQRMSILNYQQENTKWMLNAAKDTFGTLMKNNPLGLYNSFLDNPIQAQRFTSITGVGIDILKNMAVQQIQTEQERLLELEGEKLGLEEQKLDIALKQKQLAKVEGGGISEPGVILSPQGVPIDTITGKPVKLAEGDKKLLDAFNKIDNTINQLESVYSKASVKTGFAPLTRLLGVGKQVGQKLGLTSAAVREYEALVNASVGPIARAVLGEVGVLTDKDVARAKGALPSLTDTPEEARRKVANMRQIVQENRTDFFSRLGVENEQSNWEYIP
ncbi:MAG: hypothetical protein AABY15_08035, partial [Nanoarchaeota archaeon]